MSIGKILSPVVNTVKYIKSSKTLIFNTALATIGAINMYSDSLKGLFSNPAYFGLFMVIVATIGSALRFVTTKPLKEKVEEGTI